jgi:NADH-quinone oxidoreductase subunit L
MLAFFHEFPGRWFILATLAPLVPVLLLCCSSLLRNYSRPGSERTGWPRVYWLLGGDLPLSLGGILVLLGLLVSAGASITGLVHYLHDAEQWHGQPNLLNAKWAERGDWIRIGASRYDTPGAALQLGYRIDMLSALLVTMVSCVGTLIVLFSIGYMRDELKEHVEDHELHHKRRGRFSAFFLYLALFVFSMLNLLVADNLFQVFVSWELVGVCSFFLIGFYHERNSASTAANKAFIMNRIGDAGFLVGIAIAWHFFGTLNIQELIAKIDAGHPTGFTSNLWLLMGLGLFLGCVGKSAQLPLQTWLPDAMEGPTPVSALIHAATMVAAGVYLVGRCFAMFSPETFLIIAYTGAITLFVAATIACVQTDIKRVLAYSTVSQLGYMMLALGVGGWSAGLFHLFTHAFFKALLFLGSGSVIFGLHHVQDLARMGGLRKKMPITAYTMLIGVLAILGVPFFSGWYSKDQILSSVLGYSLTDATHFPLMVLPVITVGLTAYYMSRLWLLAFAGEARDHHVSDHAHESPWLMTLPLVLLAACSLGIGWGWPAWNAEASVVGHLFHEAQPADRGLFTQARKLAEQNHLIAAGLGLIFATVGVGVAYTRFRSGSLLHQSNSWWQKLLEQKWYFDRVYENAIQNNVVALARTGARVDKRNVDSPEPDFRTLDGLFNAVAELMTRLGKQVREWQSGRIREYVLALLLTVVGLLGVLALWR